MPPEFKSMIYGATLWGLKHPIEQQDIGPTFAQARQIFDASGFSGKKCSVELFSASEPEVNMKYAEAVKQASEKHNLVPVTTIFRPKPSPSMVSEHKDVRENAVAQCNRGIEFAVAATPESVPAVVNGPFQLVHGLEEEEFLNSQRRAYLTDSLKRVGAKLQAMGAYGAIEPLRASETEMPANAKYWLSLLDEIGDPNLGLLVDTVHFYEGHGKKLDLMLEAFNKVCEAKRCYSVHLSNSPNRVEWEEQGELAKHTIEFLKILKNHNCKVTCDYEGFDKPLDEVVGIVRRADQQDQTEVFARSMAYLAGHVEKLGA